MAEGTSGRRAVLAILLLAGPAAAGCVASDEEIGASEAAWPLAGLGVPVVLEWQGRLTVGAAYDLPAHVPETAPLVRDHMDAMVNFEILQVPLDLVFELEFTSADAVHAEMMVNGPFQPQGWKEWVTEASAGTRHCIRVAPDDLEPGYWYVMPHSTAAVGAEFTIRATMYGGAARFVQEYGEWPSAAETAAAQPFLDHREALACNERATARGPAAAG